MNPEQLEAIEAAVLSVADLLATVRAAERYDLRQDLRQELVIKLLRKKVRVEGLRLAAKNWILDYFKVQETRKSTEAEYANGYGKLRRLYKGPIWEPDWFPPHPDAIEHAWFACEGARVMHCKPTTSRQNDTENAIVQTLDSKGVWRK